MAWERAHEIRTMMLLEAAGGASLVFPGQKKLGLSELGNLCRPYLQDRMDHKIGPYTVCLHPITPIGYLGHSMYICV